MKRFKINFPGVGECEALLYHDASSGYHIAESNRSWLSIEDELKKIDNCNRVSIYFPEDHSETIYGKKYERISVKITKTSDIYLSWQGHSGGGDWYLTDAARKVMNERHAEMLKAAYHDLAERLKLPTKKAWLASFYEAIEKEESRIADIRRKVEKAEKGLK